MNDDNELDLPVFCGDQSIKSDTKCIRNGEWINSSSKPKKQIKCYVSTDIIERIRDIQHCVDRKFHSSNEFGGFVKWHWDNDGDIIVDDFMIPQQIVGGATVDFRSPAKPGYTGVFHKHPSGCTDFSGVDDTYINSNNDLSILFVNGTFKTGVVNINLPDSDARFQTRVNIVIGNKTRNEVDVSMIFASSEFRGANPATKAPFQERVQISDGFLPGFSGNPPSLVEFEDDEENNELVLP